MGWDALSRLAQRIGDHLEQGDVTGIVVTHGTDTLEETAFFSSTVLPHSLLTVKPVVLTCAMRPATADFPDGPQNLRDAVLTALNPAAHGVLLVCAGTVHDGRAVQKFHAYRVDAFKSGETGPLGVVEDGRIRWINPIPAMGCTAGPWKLLGTVMTAWPRVELVVNAVGVGGATVRALCRSSVEDASPLRGIVVAGTGNGTMNADMEAALRVAEGQGIRVLVLTRCAEGQVVRP